LFARRDLIHSRSSGEGGAKNRLWWHPKSRDAGRHGGAGDNNESYITAFHTETMPERPLRARTPLPPHLVELPFSGAPWLAPLTRVLVVFLCADERDFRDQSGLSLSGAALVREATWRFSIGSKSVRSSGTCMSICPRTPCGIASAVSRTPRRSHSASDVRRKGELSPAGIDRSRLAASGGVAGERKRELRVQDDPCLLQRLVALPARSFGVSRRSVV
jgi:hypothetical protein